MAKAAKTKWGDREGRRRDILVSAAAILERDGYDALSMRAVAEAAHVSPGTLYTYFENKEDLFAVLYADRLRSLRDGLVDEFAAAADTDAALQILILRYLDVYRVYGRELNLWARSAESLETGSANELVDVAVKLMSELREGLERFEPGLVSNPDIDVILQFVWSSVNGLAEQLTGTRRHIYPGHSERLIETSARIIVAGVHEYMNQPTAAR